MGEKKGNRKEDWEVASVERRSIGTKVHLKVQRSQVRKPKEATGQAVHPVTLVFPSLWETAGDLHSWLQASSAMLLLDLSQRGPPTRTPCIDIYTCPRAWLLVSCGWSWGWGSHHRLTHPYIYTHTQKHTYSWLLICPGHDSCRTAQFCFIHSLASDSSFRKVLSDESLAAVSLLLPPQSPRLTWLRTSSAAVFSQKCKFSDSKEINKNWWNSTFLPTKDSVRPNGAKISQPWCRIVNHFALLKQKNSHQVWKDALWGRAFTLARWLARAGNARF